MTTPTIVFILGAVVINVLVYGGVTWVYFADKHRPVDATAVARSAPERTDPRHDETLEDAA